MKDMKTRRKVERRNKIRVEWNEREKNNKAIMKSEPMMNVTIENRQRKKQGRKEERKEEIERKNKENSGAESKRKRRE